MASIRPAASSVLSSLSARRPPPRRHHHHHTSVATLLSPFLTSAHQCRSASILSSLSDNAGAYNKRIRRGRGPASGKGKTSGRGHKGQKQHGKVPAGFNGGQTPDEVVAGRRGFKNPTAKDLVPLNISRVAHWISTGRLSAETPITIKSLVQTRCISRAKDGVKLLARDGEALPRPIQIVVSRASAAAIGAVEKAGGQVVTRYYSQSSLARVLRGEVHPFYSGQSRPLPALSSSSLSGDAVGGADGEGEGLEDEAAAAERAAEERMKAEAARYRYRLADPASRSDIEYYRDERHRGYLSHLVPAGEGPSLYFKVPAALGGAQGRKKRKNSRAGAENRLW